MPEKNFGLISRWDLSALEDAGLKVDDQQTNPLVFGLFHDHLTAMTNVLF